MVKDGLTAEKASANCAELKRVQAGDVSYEEAKAAAASRARLEIDGVSAEKSQVHAKVSSFFHNVSFAMCGLDVAKGICILSFRSSCAR